VLDDFSRNIVAWKLGPTMCASDVTATLDQALAASGLDRATAVHRPRLLSDNGSSYVASDLAAWLEDKGMEHGAVTVITLPTPPPLSTAPGLPLTITRRSIRIAPLYSPGGKVNDVAILRPVQHSLQRLLQSSLQGLRNREARNSGGEDRHRKDE
jgi:hypothetical protein